MNRANLSERTLRRVVAVALITLALGGILYADPDRCTGCGQCSTSDFQCGLCIVIAVGRCCASPSPDAFAICDDNQWFAFCQGNGGGMTNCGQMND